MVVTVESWDGETLAHVANRVEKSNLKLAGLEGLALDDAAAASAALRQAGATGIGLVGARWSASEREPEGPGEALVGASAAFSGPESEAMAQILSAAAEAGVRLACGGDIEGAGVDLDLGSIGAADPSEAIGRYGQRLAMPPPGLVGDTEWGHKGRAYDLGYLQAVLQTIGSLYL